MNLGELIAEIRKSRKMKQKDLALQSGIPVTTLSKIENNDRQLGMKHLAKLSEGLGIPYQILLLRSLSKDEVSAEKRQIYDEIIELVNNNFFEELVE